MRTFKFVKAIILACLLVPMLSFAQSLTNDERDWSAAIQPFYREARQANIDTVIGLDHVSEAGVSPVAMMFRPETKQCIFVLAARNNFASDAIQDLMPNKAGKEIARAVATAHEYGHCIHNLQLTEKSQLSLMLPPAKTQGAEQLADVFALAWFAKNRPDDFHKAYAFLTKLRQGIGADANHNSMEFIKAAASLNDQMAKEPATPFEYAANIVLQIPLQIPGKGVTAALAVQ